jgi:uncharacterized protein HemX
MKQKKSHAGKIGLAGVAAAAAAAAGAYYLYGSKNAVKNRATAAAWMKKAEAHIVKEVKKGVKDAHSKSLEKIAAEIGKGMKSARKSIKKIVR